MKLSQLNVRAASETPAPMILRNRYAALVEQPDTGALDFPALLGSNGAPIVLRLLGAHSSVVRAHDARRKATFQTRMIARAIAAQARRRGRAAESVDVGVAGAVTADDIVAQADADMEKAVACCVDWSGIEDDDGQPLPCTDENKRALFTAMPDALAQALEFIEDTARLFQS